MPSASTTVYPVYAIVSPDRSLRLDALNELRADWKGQMDVAGGTRVDGAAALVGRDGRELDGEEPTRRERAGAAAKGGNHRRRGRRVRPVRGGHAPRESDQEGG